MRQILFKAKRKDNGEWVEGYVVFCNGKINPGQAYIAPTVSGIIALEDWAWIRLGPFVEVDPETVCQYAGMTDKKGKKIFEGDVTKYNWNGYIVYMFVEFSEGEFCLTPIRKYPFKVWTIRICGEESKIEVIGNIHDGEGKHD